MNLTKRIARAWSYLIGRDEKFLLENRIFHSFSILVILVCTGYLILNFYLSLIGPALVCVFIVAFHSWIFYISRFRYQFNLAVFLSAFECNVAIGVNYFLNAGILGPSFIMFFATLFLLTSVISKKQIWFWLVINILVVGSIVIIEYHYPKAIIGTYNDRFTHFLDTYLSYLLLVVLMVLGVSYSRNSYLKQKLELEKKSTELSKINQEKNKLFSIVSHDLRAPLLSVQHYLNLMENAEINLKDREMIISKLLKTTNNTQDLLTNLLSWSKNQMEGVKVHKVLLDLNECLKNTVEVSKEIAKEKNIELDLKIESGLKAYLDENMIQLVIRNLLNNAIKFTMTGGEVVLEAKQENQHCIINIIDNGIGISEEAQKVLFTFSTQSSSGTKNEKGTGLGLILCSEYTVLQGGEIKLKSNSGVGTKISLSFPSLQESIN